MKKNLFTLLLCLFTNFIFSQVFTIYDHKNDELYGYIVFERIEQVSKKEIKYLSTLLDINLHKVAQTTFTDDSNNRIGNIRYNGKSIYFETLPAFTDRSSIISTAYGYRIYNLQDNKVSERYELPVKNKHLYVRGGFPIENMGYGMILRNFKSQVNEFYAISDEGNAKLYSAYPYGNPKKKKPTEHIITGDIHNNLLITINQKFKDKKAKDYRTTLMLTDIFTGKIIKEVVLDTDKFNIDLSDVQITDEKVHVFGDLFDKKKTLKSGKTAGLFKAILDFNGNVLDQKVAVWSDLKSKIDIQEGGFVKKSGFIYTHNYVLDKKTNHTIVVGEYIKGGLTSVSVKDMVFLDFDENFKIHQVFEVEKKQSTMDLGALKPGSSREYGSLLKYYNYFDYRFYNELENDNGLSFFYFNVEKWGFRSMDLSHGIVVYKDGEFIANKLKWELSRKNNEFLNLLPSKPGYILLSKISKDKPIENRLEKLDY